MWFNDVSSMEIALLSSWYSSLCQLLLIGMQNAPTITHLFPFSNSKREGFFGGAAPGFGFNVGGNFFSELSGTTLLARSSGFLCVICDLSTFFKPDVTDPP